MIWCMHFRLLMAILTQEVDYHELMQGSWRFCENGTYNEIHFRDTYFDYSYENFALGMIRTYEIKGDTLLYQDRELMMRRLEIMHQDTVAMIAKSIDATSKVLLVRMDTTFVIPDSKLEHDLVAKYEDDFARRASDYACKKEH